MNLGEIGHTFRQVPRAQSGRPCAVRAMASNTHVCKPCWWGKEDVAVVTGANKGLGFFCARQLAGEAGFTTVLTARNEKAGVEALESLKKTCVQGASLARPQWLCGIDGKKRSSLLVAPVGEAAQLDFHQLDISDRTSIDAFKAWFQNKYGGRLTVLVNNAGMAYKGSTFGAQEARITMDTNYFGTADVTEALLPLMPTDGRGRVVTVASRAGLTGILRSQQLKDRFMNAKGRADVDKLVSEWLEAVETGDYARKGWPGSMYGVSKLAVNAYCKALAKELEAKHIMVNTCCPGYCDTDMTSHKGPKPAYDGARIFTWLATKPPQEFESGEFWVFDGSGVKHEM